MKKLILAAVLAVSAVSLNLKADDDCSAVARAKTDQYLRNNEAAKIAVDVMEAVYYVACNSTFKEMAEQLDEAQSAAQELYQDSQIYGILSSPVHASAQTLSGSLYQINTRLSKMAKTDSTRNTAMRFKILLKRAQALVQ